MYSVIVALRRLFRISLEHAAATKQMLLDGGLLILVLETVVGLILSDEENRRCFSPRRPTEAVEKPDFERSTSYLKTDLEEDALDLECVQACTDVENLLQKFVLDVPAAKRHVRDKSVWPDFRPMLVREGILLLQEFVRDSHPSEEEQPAAATSSKQQQAATKPPADSVEATAAAVLNQLLTPPLAHLLVEDPRTFIDVLASERVRRPVAYWDSSMLQALQQAIGEEMHRIHSAFGLDSWPAWTAQVCRANVEWFEGVTLTAIFILSNCTTGAVGARRVQSCIPAGGGGSHRGQHLRGVAHGSSELHGYWGQADWRVRALAASIDPEQPAYSEALAGRAEPSSELGRGGALAQGAGAGADPAEAPRVRLARRHLP